PITEYCVLLTQPNRAPRHICVHLRTFAFICVKSFLCPLRFTPRSAVSAIATLRRTRDRRTRRRYEEHRPCRCEEAKPTKQSRSHVARTARPRLLRFARNDMAAEI